MRRDKQKDRIIKSDTELTNAFLKLKKSLKGNPQLFVLIEKNSNSTTSTNQSSGFIENSTKMRFVTISVINTVNAVTLNATSINIFGIVHIRRLRLLNVVISSSDFDHLLQVRTIKQIEIGHIHLKQNWKILRNNLSNKTRIMFLNDINIRMIKPANKLLLTNFNLSHVDKKQKISLYSPNKIMKSLSKIETMKFFQYDSLSGFATFVNPFIQQNTNAVRNKWYYPNFNIALTLDKGFQRITPLNEPVGFATNLNIAHGSVNIHKLMSFVSNKNVILSISRYYNDYNDIGKRNLEFLSGLINIHIH